MSSEFSLLPGGGAGMMGHVSTHKIVTAYPSKYSCVGVDFCY